MKLLIGYIGKQGCGKDTAAEVMTQLLKKNKIMLDNIKVGFADALKKDISDLGLDISKKTPNIRRLLQFYGSSWRDTDPEIWIKRLSSHLSLMSPTRHVAVHIPDVRYVNEADWIKSYKGWTIRVEASDKVRAIRLKNRNGEQIAGAEHSSEVEQSYIDADFTVTNNGGIEELEYALLDILQEIKKHIEGYNP